MFCPIPQKYNINRLTNQQVDNITSLVEVEMCTCCTYRYLSM